MYANTPPHNKYYVCLPQGQEPLLWDPSDVNQTPFMGCHYYGKVLIAMEKNMELRDLIFYITWDTSELPSYGQNVVVVLLGDERYSIPTYFQKVRAVFTQFGTRPVLGCNPFLEPSYANFLALVHFVRKLISGLPDRLNYLFQKLRTLFSRNGKAPSIYNIPFGYYNQLDLPVKPIESRLYDVSFVGSVVHESSPMWSLKYWMDTPKGLSRKKMIAAMNTFKEEHPELKVHLSITPNFEASKWADAESNSRQLMDTKICLVPRGATLETHRFFEALRYGCVIVSEALPSRWYYDGAPAVWIKDWTDLNRILEKLIKDKHLMQKKHRESLEWWESRCSEDVVGAYIAQNLNPPEHPRNGSER
jgi:hypothetical protein